MYNPVNVTVQPSFFIKWALYALTSVTGLIAFLQTLHATLYGLPIYIACLWYVFKIRRRDFYFLKLRHWRLLNGQFSLQIDDLAPMENVMVDVLYVRPTFVILNIHMDGHWQRDIVLERDCDAECFRQFKAMLNLQRLQQKAS